MNILDYLKNNILITDGAMGTYYGELSHKSFQSCVLANLYDCETIEKIHLEYINSGAKLIRTNTFYKGTIFEGGLQASH